jgi:hypothetical protein
MARAALSFKAYQYATMHSIGSTHIFVVLDIQVDEFWPKVCLLSCLENLGDVDTRNKELEMLHDYPSN